MDVLIWIFIAIVFVVLELITTSFFMVWFSVGSVVAAVLNYFGFDITVQFTVFAIVSVILILSTRKFANKITPENSKKTTSDRLIGKTAKVLRKINNDTYVVSINGEEWSSHTNDSIDVDDIVKIVGINSIILEIEKFDKGD